MKKLLMFFLITITARAQGPTNVMGIQNPSASVQPPAAKAENTGFSFNPLSVRRDPFFPQSGDDQKKLKEIQKFDINQMNLVAILTGLGKPQAMIVLPNGRTEIVAPGDPIGRRNGLVSEITPTQVKIKESFKDYQNRVKADITTLEIAE